MPIDTLQADHKSLTERLVLVDSTPEALKAFMENELVPFISTMIDEQADQADAIMDLVEETASVLQEDDAAVLAAVVQSARTIAAELAKRIKAGPPQPHDAQWTKRLANAGVIFTRGQQLIEELMVVHEAAPPENTNAAPPNTEPVEEQPQ